MQRPDRPVPKTREDLEREGRVPYKVNIVKQPKPRCDPNRPRTPPGQKKLYEEPKVEEPKIEEALAQQPIATAVTAEIETQKAAVSDNIENSESVQTAAIAVDHDLSVVEDGFAHKPTDNNSPTENGTSSQSEEKPLDESPPEPEKSPEDILLETQLAAVQKQLLALSNLPSTIQATLDAVAKQLQELVPAIKSKTTSSSAELAEAAVTEKTESLPNAEGRR